MRTREITQNGTVAIARRELAYKSQDNTHEAEYTLTGAGRYAIEVDMLEPRWYQEQSYLVTRRSVPVQVAPGAVDVQVRTLKDVIGEDKISLDLAINAIASWLHDGLQHNSTVAQ